MKDFISSEGNEDEVSLNIPYRHEFRREKQESRLAFNTNNPSTPRISVPAKYAKLYGLDYDLELDIFGY